MSRGQYTSIGAERGERGGGHRGGHRGGGERGGHRGWSGGGWGGGWGGWGGGWPYSYGFGVPSYNYVQPSYNYGYALPAYDITDSGYVYNTGQLYAPSYGPSWPYAALPFYGAAAAFPHRSQRFHNFRHRRRFHHILGQDL